MAYGLSEIQIAVVFTFLLMCINVFKAILLLEWVCDCVCVYVCEHAHIYIISEAFLADKNMIWVADIWSHFFLGSLQFGLGSKGLNCFTSMMIHEAPKPRRFNLHTLAIS